MQSKTLTGGQALVRLLANYGGDTVFGIPGVHTLELYRGLPGSGIRHVLTRHEQGAGFMADGYARVRGWGTPHTSDHPFGRLSCACGALGQCQWV